MKIFEKSKIDLIIIEEFEESKNDLIMIEEFEESKIAFD
jgi:hypothetical protein